MPRRIEQLNEQLRKKLAELIVRSTILRDGLITVTYVACSPDLKYAKIAVSVLPENLSGIVLKKLKKHSSQFCEILKKQLTIRQIPKFNWIIDHTEENAAAIEKIFKQIEEEKHKSNQKNGKINLPKSLRSYKTG